MKIKHGHQVVDGFESLILAGSRPARRKLQPTIQRIARQKVCGQEQFSVLNSNSKHLSSPLDDASEFCAGATP